MLIVKHLLTNYFVFLKISSALQLVSIHFALFTLSIWKENYPTFTFFNPQPFEYFYYFTHQLIKNPRCFVPTLLGSFIAWNLWKPKKTHSKSFVTWVTPEAYHLRPSRGTTSLPPLFIIWPIIFTFIKFTKCTNHESATSSPPILHTFPKFTLTLSQFKLSFQASNYSHSL